MGLFGRSLIAGCPHDRVKRELQTLGASTARRRDQMGNVIGDALVVEIAGCGHHDVAGSVVGRVVVGDDVARHRGDGLARSEHRSTKRMMRKERRVRKLVHHIVRRVVAHADFLEDHVAFGLDLVGPEGRTPHDVGEDVQRQLEVVVRNPHVERGVLLCGEGVHVTADGLDRGGDVGRGALSGPLEEQVLQEMAGTELPLVFVDGTGSHPEANGDRSQIRHRFGDDSGTPDLTHFNPVVSIARSAVGRWIVLSDTNGFDRDSRVDRSR